MIEPRPIAKPFLLTALLLLVLAALFGLLASLSYLFPEWGKQSFGFIRLRPMHATAALCWIFVGATGAVYSAIEHKFPGSLSRTLIRVQWSLWLVALIGAFGCYSLGIFGGREYWEFPPVVALPIALSWLVMLVHFARVMRNRGPWPVYHWMWMTGIAFFLFTFIENYLWLFPYFRAELITDLTIQWKVNGSMVGAWNQMLYGTSIYLMERISGNDKLAKSRMAFFLYFLGLFNLMFNWGHHIYTLPTDAYVKYFGYLVSMTEWFILLRMLYLWRSSLSDYRRHAFYFPYRFMIAAEVWLLLNLFQALLMSIPAINLYTHGTHVTVAHAMGTTIGINTMILFAAMFTFLEKDLPRSIYPLLSKTFFLMQGSLLLFWISLLAAGFARGQWQLNANERSFAEMMQSLQPMFVALVASGTLLTVALMVFAGYLGWYARSSR
ncbi:MAG: cbb3-type cytochrome c oxidase subunit I [Saprospiraceae bacterium]|jgi:nitric oxide reductase subunit B|nr:cbb3-type cytochrome c oxidase subunit I [Saprospiraceae bacterium]MBP9209314.1 cbb3-type cytochrome c oxidase subunit I [Saprospiraceae bacterium]MBV6474278.1 hypothetical protein [Saprospiraceae bacterium]